MRPECPRQLARRSRSHRLSLELVEVPSAGVASTSSAIYSPRVESFIRCGRWRPRSAHRLNAPARGSSRAAPSPGPPSPSPSPGPGPPSLGPPSLPQGFDVKKLLNLHLIYV